VTIIKLYCLVYFHRLTVRLSYSIEKFAIMDSVFRKLYLYIKYSIRKYSEQLANELVEFIEYVDSKELSYWLSKCINIHVINRLTLSSLEVQ